MIGAAVFRKSLAVVRDSSAAERALVVSCLSDSVGTGLFFAVAATFFTHLSGLTPAQYALGLSLAGLVGFALTVPMGVLADRFGARRTLITLNLWRAVGYAAYVLVDSAPVYLVVILLTAVADRTAGGVGQAVIADVAGPGRRVQLSAVIRSVRNIGYAVGGLVAGIAIAVDRPWVYHGAMIGIALFYVLCAALLLRVRTMAAPSAGTRPKREWAFRDRRFLAFTGLNTPLSLHASTLNVLLPLWILSTPGLPDGLVSASLILNTVIVSLFQLPATRHISTIVGAGRAALASAVLLAGACVLFLASSWTGRATTEVPALVCGVLALTLAEMWQAASSWQISMDLSGEANRAQYLSTFSLSTTAERVIGPTVLTVVILNSPTWGWIALAAVFLASGLATWRLTRTTPNGHTSAPAPLVREPAADGAPGDDAVRGVT
ncbi:MFS transporter [Kitasatospora sp. NPDC001660]